MKGREKKRKSFYIIFVQVINVLWVIINYYAVTNGIILYLRNDKNNLKWYDNNSQLKQKIDIKKLVI